MSLKETLSEALSLHTSLREIAPTHPDFNTTLKKALRLLSGCQADVNALGIYSPNETVEDISTAELPFLSLDLYISQLIEMTPVDPKESARKRISLVRLALRKVVDFMCLLENVGLPMPKSWNSSNVLESGRFSSLEMQGFLRSPSISREQKVATFKRMKELKTQAALANPHDEESKRERELLFLELRSMEAMDLVASLCDELRLLSAMDEATKSFAFRNIEYCAPEALQEAYEIEYQGPTLGELHKEPTETKVESDPRTLIGPGGKIMRPFILTKRDQLQRQVMGTGQYLPTISLEDFVAKELANGGMLQPTEKVEVDPDTEEAADAETMKQRRWDEFTDANPRGSGNTMNRG